MNKIERAIIFAAGKGTRMNPLTEHTPKPLIEVHGEKILERNIIFLKSVGINEIIIVVGYLKNQFSFLKEKYGVKLLENTEYNETNNISSMVVTKKLWENTLYIEGDIYLKENILENIVKIIKDNNFKNIMFGSKISKYIDEWKFNLSNNGKIINHSHPAKKGDIIWAGIYFVNKITGKEIPQKIDNWYKNNKQLYAEQFLWTLNNKFILKEINYKSFAELDYFEDLIKMDPSYSSHRNKTLFTPGPTNIPSELRSVLGGGIVHHRSKLASFYINKLTSELRKIFLTEHGFPVILTGSGTAGMEFAVVNSMEKSNKSLILSNGDFGERFKDIHESYGLKYKLLDFGKYNQYDFDLIKKEAEDCDVIFSIHHETSTGMLNNIKKLRSVIGDKLLVVDSISSIIIEDFQFDNWEIDIALASTPKAFSLSPGLTFVCMSEKSLKISEKIQNKSFYFDAIKYKKYFDNFKQTPFTPAISLVLATVAAIERINNISIFKYRDDRHKIFQHLKKELNLLGFKNVIKKEFETIAMIVLKPPVSIKNIEEFRNLINRKYDIYFEVGRNGSNTIRIGLIGTISMELAKKLISSIKKELKNIR